MTRLTRKTVLAPLTAWLVAAALAPQASASGFQLREQSPSAQGTAFAGVTAGGSDIGSMFFNPATLTQFQDNEAVIGFSDIMPDAKLEGAAATRAAGSTITGPTSTGNTAKSALLPNLYAMWSLNPSLKLGLSVNAPFGMITDHDADFLGRYHALKSDLQVMDYAPSIAFRINSQWSVGAAFVARKADAELTNAADFGSAVGAPGAFDGVAGLKGSAWGYGYRLGVTFEPSDKVHFGVAYHSAMSMTLDGDATFQFKAGTPAPVIAGLQASHYVNGSASAELDLPSTTSLGVHVDATDRLAVLGEIQRTNWSKFKELRVKFSTGLKDSVTDENWQDTWFYSLGLAWKATDKLTLRTGVAYDQSAVKDEFRTPRIPDGDRTWLSAGVGYAFTKTFAMDFAYTHIFVKDGVMELKAIPAGYTAANSPNITRGNLSGTYKNSIDIFALQAKFDF
jgi:long-chain fatty acid transport protein